MEIVKAFNENNMHININIKGTYDNPLFKASDIGEILEISNVRQSIVNFDDTEKVAVSTTDTIGRDQSVTYLTEIGLYQLLFISRKPIAKIFKKWVCEIIKEIRIQGSYHLEQQLKEKDEQLKEKNEELKENKKLIEDLELLKQHDDTPTIYIYNIDTRKQPPDLKIGYTMNVYKRIKPYNMKLKAIE
jgi:prophage antirepressor-like protein